jgi:hypothetical protein
VFNELDESQSGGAIFGTILGRFVLLGVRALESHSDDWPILNRRLCP